MLLKYLTRVINLIPISNQFKQMFNEG